MARVSYRICNCKDVPKHMIHLYIDGKKKGESIMKWHLFCIECGVKRNTIKREILNKFIQKHTGHFAFWRKLK